MKSKHSQIRKVVPITKKHSWQIDWDKLMAKSSDESQWNLEGLAALLCETERESSKLNQNN